MAATSSGSSLSPALIVILPASHSTIWLRLAKAMRRYSSSTRSGVMPSRAARAVISSSDACAAFRRRRSCQSDLINCDTLVGFAARVRGHRLTQFRQCSCFVPQQSGFVKNKMRSTQILLAQMRFQGAERGDQDARRRLLADAASSPTLLQRPLLERALPADDVPQARAGGRSDAAQGADRAPDRPARRLDPQPPRVVAAPPRLVAQAPPRPIERPPRRET